MNSGLTKNKHLIASNPSIWFPIWLILIITAVSISVIIWFHYQALNVERDRSERSAKSLANGLASSIEDDLVLRNYAQLEASLKLALASEDVRSALITDANGHVLSFVKAVGNEREAIPAYDTETLQVPSRTVSYEEYGNTSVLWTPVGSKRLAGFLRFEFQKPQVEYEIRNLRKRVIASIIGGSFISIFLLIVVMKRLHDLFETRELDLIAEQDILFNAACYDALTRLPNRRLFLERLDQAIANSDRNASMLAVVFCDVDGFKYVNDNLGHEAGDELLITIARQLDQATRQIDTVSRFGGDEFVILLTKIQRKSDVTDILDRVMTISKQPLNIRNSIVRCPLSAGISLYPDDARNVHDLFENADKAMYHAKKSGKARYFFYKDMPSNLEAIEAQ